MSDGVDRLEHGEMHHGHPARVGRRPEFFLDADRLGLGVPVGDHIRSSRGRHQQQGQDRGDRT
jgi:hypothetical protein